MHASPYTPRRPLMKILISLLVATSLVAATPVAASHVDWFEDGKVTLREGRHQIAQPFAKHADRRMYFILNTTDPTAPGYAVVDPRVARTTSRVKNCDRVERSRVNCTVRLVARNRRDRVVGSRKYRMSAVAYNGGDSAAVENLTVLR